MLEKRGHTANSFKALKENYWNILNYFAIVIYSFPKVVVAVPAVFRNTISSSTAPRRT